MFSSCSEFTVPQCSIEGAVDGAVGGDQVILRPGTYMASEGLVIDAAFDVHGQDGQPTPTVTFGSPVDANPLFLLSGPGGGSLRNVILESSRQNSSVPSTLTITDPAALVDGVFVHSSIPSAGFNFACKVEQGTIRDSVCWNDGGTGSAGLGTLVNDTLTRSATLRNVTAIGSGTNAHGIAYDQINNTTGGTVNVDAKSVIAVGNGAAAIHAGANSPSTVTITLDHSLYPSEEESVSGGTITDPGSGSNIFGPALLSADFHELAGSPSIDAGAVDGSSGTNDIDREARVQGAAPDIGADEFVPAPAGSEGTAPAKDILPPITTLAKGPKKRTTKHKAKFQFVSNEPGSTFRCKLDKKAFAACSAPKTVRVKTGKHTFKVEAIDPAGNIDPTPAVFHWKVLPK